MRSEQRPDQRDGLGRVVGPQDNPDGVPGAQGLQADTSDQKGAQAVTVAPVQHDHMTIGRLDLNPRGHVWAAI